MSGVFNPSSDISTKIEWKDGVPTILIRPVPSSTPADAGAAGASGTPTESPEAKQPDLVDDLVKYGVLRGATVTSDAIAAIGEYLTSAYMRERVFGQRIFLWEIGTDDATSVQIAREKKTLALHFHNIFKAVSELELLCNHYYRPGQIASLKSQIEQKIKAIQDQIDSVFSDSNLGSAAERLGDFRYSRLKQIKDSLSSYQKGMKAELDQLEKQDDPKKAMEGLHRLFGDGSAKDVFSVYPLYSQIRNVSADLMEALAQASDEAHMGAYNRIRFSDTLSTLATRTRVKIQNRPYTATPISRETQGYVSVAEGSQIKVDLQSLAHSQGRATEMVVYAYHAATEGATGTITPPNPVDFATGMSRWNTSAAGKLGNSATYFGLAEKATFNTNESDAFTGIVWLPFCHITLSLSRSSCIVSP